MTVFLNDFGEFQICILNTLGSFLSPYIKCQLQMYQNSSVRGRRRGNTSKQRHREGCSIRDQNFSEHYANRSQIGVHRIQILCTGKETIKYRAV